MSKSLPLLLGFLCLYLNLYSVASFSSPMKVSVYIATSLDGFIARENGSLDWLPGSDPTSNNEQEEPENQDDHGFSQFMDSVDTIIMGRKTFEQVLSFGADAWAYGSKRVIVLSRSGKVEIPDRVVSTVECKSALPKELIRDLEIAGTEHVYVDGGNVIQQFLRDSLVTELILTKIPILIGSGIPLFGPFEKDIQLKHVETRELPGGFVQSRYTIV